MAASTKPMAAAFPGLELLATAVVVLDDGYVVRYTNPAAENLLGAGARSLIGPALPGPVRRQRGRSKTCWPRRLRCTGATARRPWATSGPGASRCRCPASWRRSTRRARRCWSSCGRSRSSCARSARNACSTSRRPRANCCSNLAHEIKNPLGGLRGSAQLLERELDRPELREYTQVIIKEADRLQVLLDRLLTPRRAVQLAR